MADTSLDSSFDITAEVIESTPIEKCSLNPRRGRNSRRLLTGFIIYASEVRKEVVEQYPNENFGFISKLVGDKWRALNTDLRFKYHQRALIHNKRIKELAAREGVPLGDVDLASGSVMKTPKSTKKKLAKLSKREKSLNDSSAPTTPIFDSKLSSISPETPIPASTSFMGVPQMAHRIPINNNINNNCGDCFRDSSTQTPSIRFVEPAQKKPLSHSEAFLTWLHTQIQERRIGPAAAIPGSCNG